MRLKSFKTLFLVLALLGDALPSQLEMVRPQKQLSIKYSGDINYDLNNNVNNETENCVEEDGKILSRQKRNFGGPEAINFPLVYDSVLGVKGWLASGIEVFQDILFHLTGYTIIGITYNFGEGRKNPDKVRQRYLDSMFGPTPLTTSALRAFRNPLFQFTFRFWYDTIVHTKNMTESVRNTNMTLIAKTWLSEPYLHTKIFRDTCTVYFTSIGWAVYYIVFKWSTNQPLIAGRRKKRSTDAKILEEILDHLYRDILLRIDSCDGNQSQNGNAVSTIPSDLGPTDNFFFVQGLNTVASEDLDLSRAYGDYQFYLSYGGDQYFNVPRVIDNVFGPPGIYRQLGHILAQTNFEAAGYTAIGFMYNGYYRSLIKDQEVRKFLDSFVGPTIIVSHAMRIIRNALGSLTTRVILLTFLPQTRPEIIRILSTFTFKAYKNTVMSETFLLARIHRHLLEYGFSIIGTSTLWFMFRYKKAFIDPPPEKAEKEGKKKVSEGGSSAATKKPPSIKRKYWTSPSAQSGLLEAYHNSVGYDYEKFVYDDEADFFKDNRKQFNF